MNQNIKSNKIYKILFVVSLFSIAMGFLESAVVIYLREIFYPQGFDFPLVPITPDLILTEVLREAATLIMLVSVGYLAGRNSATRFAWFLYSFAVWDIFYYVFLKLLIAWPESLFTWDVLFLIPLTWTGPVLTPLLLTALMIAFTLLILRADSLGYPVRLNRGEWSLLISGSLLTIVAFVTDYSRFILSRLSPGELSKTGLDEIKLIAASYVPDHFPWLLFAAGVMIISVTIFFYGRRIFKTALPDVESEAGT
ncbi:MAG: hypothetical protein ACOYXB_10050 [Bacteroidota bacterium]